MRTKNHGQFVDTLPWPKDEDNSKVECKLSRLLLNTRQSFLFVCIIQSMTFLIWNNVFIFSKGNTSVLIYNSLANLNNIEILVGNK